MKFTKLIASLAAITTVMTSITPIFTLTVNADSEENTAAYEWAVENDVTSMPTYSAFMPESNVTREAAAKFLVAGADALGISMDSDQDCEYEDLDDADQSLTDYIIEGCAMGLFKAQANFNAKQTMTRGQALTVIARMVHGMDDVLAYADDNNMSEAAAAEAMLMDDGVVNVHIPFEAGVKRLHLILILYRMQDMDITPPCTVGVDCPVVPPLTGDTGAVVEVKNGNLELSLNGSTLANNTQIPSTGTVRFAVVNFTAGNADVSVRSVKIAKMGLATMPSTTRIWFEKNGIRVSGKAAFTSEGDALVSFAPSLVVKAGATETLDLYVELATVAGYDLQFQSTVVDSSAQSTNG